MKVAFFCQFNYNKIIDLENLEFGNIGLGGTQYLYLLIINNLIKKYGNDNEYILLTNQNLQLSKDITTVVVDNENVAMEWCLKNDVDIVVFREFSVSKLDCSLLESAKINVIVWAHNFINKKIENIIYKYDCIKKVVCVSESQFKIMQNSICASKCTFINNCLGSYVDSLECKPLPLNNNLFYVSAIEPTRGTFETIKIFNKVHQKHPDSKLYIIGGLGTLRSDKILIGNRGLTYQKYENKIFKFIDKHNIRNSVYFLGILDAKNIHKLIKENSGVGIVNASYTVTGETFCMSAIEMQSYGLPVVARQKKDGLNTTVANKNTGFLCRNNRQIIDKITTIFDDKNLYNELSCNCVKHSKKFSVTTTIDCWYELFKRIIDNKDVPDSIGIIVKLKKLFGVNFYTPKEIIKKIKSKIVMEYYRYYMK